MGDVSTLSVLLPGHDNARPEDVVDDERPSTSGQAKIVDGAAVERCNTVEYKALSGSGTIRSHHKQRSWEK